MSKTNCCHEDAHLVPAALWPPTAPPKKRRTNETVRRYECVCSQVSYSPSRHHVNLLLFASRGELRGGTRDVTERSQPV